THLYCTMGLGKPLLFGEGLRKVRKEVKGQYIRWIYECSRNGVPLEDVLKRLKAA
ncbi:Hypothetical protein DPCES_5406, partial [Desulfitobacterium hafniense]